MLTSSILNQWSNPYHQGLSDLGMDGDDWIFGQEGFLGEGPYMKVALLLQDNSVSEIWFETYPCPAAIACGSALARWLEGRSLDEAIGVTEAIVSQLVGGLPLGKEHCARIAVNALRSALRQIDETRE